MSIHTEGPWQYVASTVHHGPYVTGPWGGDICDCYVMSNPAALSTRNGGESYPIPHEGERADANARLISAAPDLLAALKAIRDFCDDPNGSEKPESLAMGLARLLPEARAAIAKAEGRS